MTKSENTRKIFAGHGTFPLRYGWLKKCYDAIIEDQSTHKGLSKNLFLRDEAISVFGVGKNMLGAIRYWSFHTGIIDENANLTDLAKQLFSDEGFDPWMEDPFTLWYIHYKLVSNPNLVTTFWFFNIFNGNIFSKEELLSSLKKYLIQEQIPLPSLVTLKRDLDCLILTYAGKQKSSKKVVSTSEDAIQAPLCELGLVLSLDNRDTFKLNHDDKPTLSTETFSLVLFEFWNIYSPSTKTLSIESIKNTPGSPGRVFLMDEDSLVLKLKALIASSSYQLEWIETAGLKQLRRVQEIDQLTLIAKNEIFGTSIKVTNDE